jgi:carboxyl-terminal processing protease
MLTWRGQGVKMDFMEKTIFLPKVTLRNVRRFLIFFIVVVISFSSGYLVASKGYKASFGKPFKVTISRELPKNHKDVNFTLFWRVWDTLEAKYFDKEKLDQAEMIYGAIKGMVTAVGDPYTVFLPPSENKIVQEDLQGSFEGVGIQIGFKGSRLAVIAPLPGSPAEKVGIKAGDFIVGIKDEVKGINRGTNGITLPEAVKIIRGPKGTIVTLTLLRDKVEEPIEVNVVRDSIDVPSIILSFVGDNESIAHIKLLKFSGETKNEWSNVVREILKKRSVRGIVLDLRNNPGGYLQAAVDLASEFLKNGSVVVVEESSSGERKEFKVERLGRFLNMPVVVLINQGSASASEILAGALRDDKNILLVGEDSFGKGTIQEPIQINGSAGLHITTSRWLTPSGFWVNEKGLTPDVKIKDDPATPEDEQLEKAIELLNK